MFSIALKNLLQEKTRLLISVGGVAFSVLLMILLQGLNIGYRNVLGQYFSTVPTDLWVAKANTGNIMDPSYLPLSTKTQLEDVNGVKKVEPFGMQALTANIKGKDVPAYIVAFSPDTGIGKPSRISEGKAEPDRGEIVIDRITAKANNLQIGDTIPLATKQFKVVGLSEGTYILTYSFAFINKDDATGTFSVPDTTNYWLVTLKPDADLKVVQAAINKQLPTVNAHSKDHFVQVNVDVVKNIVQPVFGALVVLGALIGTAVIGLTIFVATIEKAKEYGVLKAIGFRNRQLYTIVLQQALLAAVLGYALGLLLSLIVNPILTNAVPQFVTQIRFADLLWIFGLTLLMAITASYVPTRRLNKIDPAEVFRS